MQTSFRQACIPLCFSDGACYLALCLKEQSDAFEGC